jgi:hypothetical protein
MCAPFAKQRVVTEVLSVVPDGVKILLFTRWRPDEVAAGVSDTEVLSVIRSRGGAVYLHDRLHAKYYRNESGALLGSANLTATALGWVPISNLELLVASSDGAINSIEECLKSESVVATDEIAQEVEEIAQLLPMRAEIPQTVASPEPTNNTWVPSLRMPSDLFTAYGRGTTSLASRSAAAAAADLSILDLPTGLNRAQFEILVGHRLRNQPLFRAIDEFLGEPRRFGEVRQLMGHIMGFDRDQAEESWQTTMRWMFEFLPERYSRQTFGYSEVVSLATTKSDSVR